MDFLKLALARLVSTPYPIQVATPNQSPSRGTSFANCLPHSLASFIFRQAGIGKLSDKILLKIFCYYLDDSPPFWPMLGHICRRWRQIVFGCFRLYFTHGTPVSKTLDCRHALPIVVEYGGTPALDPPAREDEDNIMVALGQSDRVRYISLTVTGSLLEKLSAIERPFSELEDLVLLSRDSVPPTLPSAFRWGPRLRRLHSTGVAFPALLRLLHSSRDLVDLQLHRFLSPSHFSPEALTDALSGMTRLESLSLHFLSTAYYLHPTPPSRERVVLPVLTRLKFWGNIEYSEGLMSKIDAPRLEDIEVAFSHIVTLRLSKLSEFIDRIEFHRSHSIARILSSENAVSISLIRPGTPTRLTLRLFCKPFSEQLSFVTHICIRLSALLSNVEDLHISAMQPSSLQGDNYRKRWRGVIHRFEGKKRFHLAVGDHPTNIVFAVQLSEAVQPALHKLYIPQPGPHAAPLREALVSLMTSRRLSGHPIAVEYERLCHIGELRDTGIFSQPVTIEVLSDDILLNVFCHYLDVTPGFWPTLLSVCQRWQQVVCSSPRGLNLRLFCTYGTPVLNALDCWPTLRLPIVVQYGGVPNLEPPAPKEYDNIVAALKQSGRVTSISLTVTRVLLGKLSAISEPFSELEELVLISSQYDVPQTLPTTFRWGTRLRTLHSTRISLPSFPRLLSSSQDLINLRLHEIPETGYFPPEAFANALSGMTQLQTLSLHFLSLPPQDHLGLPPLSGERIVLPSLACFEYRGASKYLDSLADRIEAPRLGKIDITFSGQPTMATLELGRFIERVEMCSSLSQAEIQTSGYGISISFSKPGVPPQPGLRVSYEGRVSAMTHICHQFSPLLFRVKDICISSAQLSIRRDDTDRGQWLELMAVLGGANDFRVSGVHLTDILCALHPAHGVQTTDTTILPSLRSLHLEQHMTSYGPAWDAVQSFIASRWLSGRPIELYAHEYSCHVCQDNFSEQQTLKIHLVDRHAYRIVCSYCEDFESLSGYNSVFQEHLESKHPEVARNDPLFSSPSLSSRLQVDSLDYRHCSLHAPDVFEPSTTVTVLHP